MGLVLTAGGVVGSVIGVAIFSSLRARGQLDVFVALAYVTLLSAIGGLMLTESISAIRRGSPSQRRRRGSRFAYIQRLPWKMVFPASGLATSVIPVLVIGAVVGLLAALMGVGGGFIMVPAMIYLLRMPTNVVIGTSLFQIVFVTALTTLLQSVQNQTVDVVLAAILIVGGVVGAQMGARFGARIKAEQLRALLAIVVMTVGLMMLIDLVRPPGELFTLLPVT
jgi:uncharacterized membrane protein YfcA